jgi:hypothetical protein
LFANSLTYQYTKFEEINGKVPSPLDGERVRVRGA